MKSIVFDWLKSSNKLERIWLMAKIEFKLRYYENKLGLLWALIKPISDIFIYYVAFELIMKQGIPNFVSFLFIALIQWNFFVEATAGTIQILKVKKYLYEYTNMNKLEIYISTIISSLIGLFFNFIMFLVYYLFIAKNTTPLNLNALYFIPIVINLIILALAFSIILSNIYIIAKDITQIWAVVVGVAFWVSPILFKLDAFRLAMPTVEYVNPISYIIINSRRVILDGQSPDWYGFFYGLGYSILLLVIGLIILNKLGSKAAEQA